MSLISFFYPVETGSLKCALLCLAFWTSFSLGPTELFAAAPTTTEQGPGLELIQNGSFSSKLFAWKKTDYYYNYFESKRAAESYLEVVNESAKITVKRRGHDSWHAHLIQSGFVLEKGKRYRLSFRVKISQKDRETPVTLVTDILRGGESFERFFEFQDQIEASDVWQTLNYEFTSPADDDFMRLDINYGRLGGDTLEPEKFVLWLDDVSLVKLSDNWNPYRVTPGKGRSFPVQDYGPLYVNPRGQLSSSKTRAPVQLRGMSLHGVQWDRPWYFVNREAFLELKDQWRADMIRLPIYLGQAGLLEDPSILDTVHQVIELAIDLGMYVIVDWHVHNDAGNPNRHIEKAKTFFRDIVKKYGHHPNLIFEIANEPNGTEWSEISRYSEEVIPVIRAGSQNVVLVGTPVWSQEILKAAELPVKATNILYSLHFYSASHPLDAFKDNIEMALKHGIGIFVSEFGTTPDSGKGLPSFAETRQWLDYLDSKGISWVNWSLSNEQEESAALQPWAHPVPSQRGGWKEVDISDSGKFVKDRLRRPRSFSPH